MRLREIMHADPTARKPKPKWLCGLLAAALLPVAAAQFAWAQGDDAAAAARLTVMPIDAPISSPFGTRTDPLTLKLAFHQGVDFTVPTGTPVHAPADGKVVRAEEQPGWGLVIQIIHKGGLATRYAHLDKAQVTVGDHVKAGDVIATSGNSGKGTGPHLHFEVWKDGKPVDPTTVLPVRVSSADGVGPALIAADSLRNVNGVAVASGNVDLHQDGRTVHADRIGYDGATHQIIASNDAAAGSSH